MVSATDVSERRCMSGTWQVLEKLEDAAAVRTHLVLRQYFISWRVFLKHIVYVPDLFTTIFQQFEKHGCIITIPMHRARWILFGS